MLIKLHGKFAEDYPGDFEIEADTVADAVEGWSRQVEFYADIPLEFRPVARIIGFDTDEKIYAKTEQKEIHIVPAMLGGGGNFGKILLGAALIAAAFYVPFLGGTIGNILISMGATLVLTGVMGFLTKAPTVGSNDPEASKYLGLSNNTTTIGTPIAICYGCVPVDGQVMALNVDSTDMITGTFPTTPT